MTTSSAPSTNPMIRSPAIVSAGSRRLYAISVGITVLFIFIQSITAGTFIEGGLPKDARETWTNIHGGVAYPVMVFALISAVIAIVRLRQVNGLAFLTSTLFVATVAQWLSGHMISNLQLDWVTPHHVVLAFVIYGLAIALSVRSAALRRLSQREV